MFRPLPIFFFVAAPAAFIAASALAPAAPVPEDARKPLYFPTKVGTTLVYTRDKVEETWTVTRSEPRDDGRVVTAECSVADRPRSTLMVLVSPKGLFLTPLAGGPSEPPMCLLRLPHEPGTRWTASLGTGASLVLTGRMTAGEEERITVPAGKFAAVRVDWAFEVLGGTRTASCWFAREVGLVRLDIGESSMVLKKVIPAKD